MQTRKPRVTVKRALDTTRLNFTPCQLMIDVESDRKKNRLISLLRRLSPLGSADPSEDLVMRYSATHPLLV